MSDYNRLLIVDDEAELRSMFRDVAEDMGFAVAEAGNQEDFITAYDRLDPTAVLLDLTMPDIDGVELLRDLGERGCTAPIILASGQDERVISTAQRLGRMFGLTMLDVLQKPVAVSALESALQGVWVEAAGITPEALEQAVAMDRFVPHFQPKIDLQNGETYPIIGSEALIRWMHPTRGLVMPGEFIGIAEDSNLIGSITEVLLRKTIAELTSWQHQGLALPVSINLSAKQLTDLCLPDRIASQLSEAGLDSKLLAVEITEQAAMSDVRKAADILTRLRLKNIAVSLDDFGAGYSSLAEIYRLPLSELKFDRSLIMDLDHDPDARTVVKALIALAHELGMPVCAEGIETVETAEFLRDIGCERAQGFLFSRPVPADAYLDLVRAQTEKSADAEGLPGYATA